VQGSILVPSCYASGGRPKAASLIKLAVICYVGWNAPLSRPERIRVTEPGACVWKALSLLQTDCTSQREVCVVLHFVLLHGMAVTQLTGRLEFDSQ
jgi:hypothetical protein